MGGPQAQRAVFGYPDVFANLGLFSTHFNAESDNARMRLSDPEQFRKDFDLIFLGAGESEPVWEFNRNLAWQLRKEGHAIVFFGAPGHHDWHVWRHCAREFLKRLWV